MQLGKIALDRLKIECRNGGLTADAGYPAGQARQIGKCLIVQVHSKTLALTLHPLGQPERSNAHQFFVGFGLTFQKRRRLCVGVTLQSEKIGRQNVRRIHHDVNILCRILADLTATYRQGPDDFTLHPQRHNNSAVQFRVKYCGVVRSGKVEACIFKCIRRQQKRKFAPD